MDGPRLETGSFSPGTDSSNPSPSSGESPANLTSSIVVEGALSGVLYSGSRQPKLGRRASPFLTLEDQLPAG